MLIAVRGRRKTGLAVLAAVAALATPACSDSEPAPAPPEISGPPQRVARAVERLERAIRVRDFDTVCDDLLTAAARARAGGARCAATMADDVRGLRRPRLRLLSIRIAGRGAAARVRTDAAGQGPVADTLRLERSGRGYRISALSR
jgi:hypothetical protein